jgi:gliding motility-associated-like protein
MKKCLTFPIILFLLSLTSTVHAQETAVLDWVGVTDGGNTSLGSIVNASTIDATGNIYTTGYFEYTCDFDPGPGVFNLSPVGGRDLYVLKLNANGDFLWAISLGNNGSQSGTDIAVDPSGNIYITGEFGSGIMDFDPGPDVVNLDPEGLQDIIIVKLDPNGDFLWVKMVGGGGLDRAYSIDVDNDGNIYTAGVYGNTTDFDPGPGTVNISGSGGFLLKLTSNGDYVWVSILPAVPRKVKIDFSGNAIISGLFNVSTNFSTTLGTVNLVPVGFDDVFIAKVLSSNSIEWVKGFGGTNGEKINSLAIDDSNNIYMAGEFVNTVDFDPGPGIFSLSTNSTTRGAFICKLNTLGNFVLARQLSGTGFTDAFSIAIDGSENIYTSGRFGLTTDFDPGGGTFNYTALGNTNAFVCKLNSLGDFDWAVRMGGNSGSDANAYEIMTSSSGLYLAGTFRGTVDFDPGACAFNIYGGSGELFFQKLIIGVTPPAPTLTFFSPSNGSIGTSVVITGTNFSTTPEDNIVKFFNDRTAVVTVSTNTTLTTTVPAGTTTGKISVTTNCITVISATDFTLGAALVPTITSFTPVSGSVGTTITITGTNFSATPASNTVEFNGTPAVVTASTATSITTTVPVGATTGKITVTIASNTATSATDFTVIVSAPNQPPVINTTTTTTTIGGAVSINLIDLISDPDDNLVLGSLTIILPPTSGASATLVNSVLEVDYNGINFSGRDQLTIQVCDASGECTQQVLEIEVIGDIIVYSGISPNGDTKNDTWVIEYITLFPDTQSNRVTIYNRWGDLVWEGANYDNNSIVFTGLNKNGNELTTGTYFYKIEFTDRETITGFLSLKR